MNEIKLWEDFTHRSPIEIKLFPIPLTQPPVSEVQQWTSRLKVQTLQKAPPLQKHTHTQINFHNNVDNTAHCVKDPVCF